MNKLGKYRCFYCDKVLNHRVATKHHIQPLSRNGSNNPQNIVYSCKDCVALKGCLSLDEFRVVIAYRMGLIKNINLKFPGE